jgi:hypothetical protein
MVAELNKQLQFLQDQKAMSALAQGNPDEFITYAQTRIQSMQGEEKTLWEGLITKATDKIDEEKWAALIKADDTQLEAFLEHLDNKFDTVEPGSSAAFSILTAMDGAQKAIKARDQNIADQQALLEYVKSNDHMKYARYMATKLAGTTDPSMIAKIQNNIEELRTRQATEERVARTKTRADIAFQYLDGGMPAGKAIAMLQELALDPKITQEEVSSIQVLVTQIHDREVAEARRGSSASQETYGLDVTAFEKNYAQYLEDKRVVDEILAAGGDPNIPFDGQKNSPANKLSGSASILSAQYKTASENAAAQGKVTQSQTFANQQNSIQTHLGGIPEKTDRNLVARAVKQSNAEFNKTVALQGGSAAGKARTARIEALGAIYNSIVTPQVKDEIKSEIRTLSSDERLDIAKQATGMGSLSKDEQETLKADYAGYVENWRASYGTEKNPENGGPVSMSEFIKAAIDAKAKGKKPEEVAALFAQATGIRVRTNLLGAGSDAFENAKDSNAKGSDFVNEVAELGILSGIVEGTAEAEERARKLLSIPGATPFGPVGTIDHSILGLTAQDLVELRRGAGLIGRPKLGLSSSKSGPGLASALQEDLTSYEDSEQELRRERRLEKQKMEEAAAAARPSIEDSLLQPLIGTEPYLMMGPQLDPGNVDMAQLIPTEEPKEDNIDLAMKYLDSSTDIEMPGYEFPTIPEPDIFSDPALTEYDGFQQGIPDDTSWELPMPKDGQMHGPY